MPVVWLPQSKTDIQRLFGFLKEKNPVAAENAVAAIRAAAVTLQAYPEIGRPLGDEAGNREHVIPFGGSQYVLRYRIASGTAVVIRVWHSRETR